MFQSRSILLQRGPTRLVEGALPFVRQFSVTHGQANDDPNGSGRPATVNRSTSSTVSPLSRNLPRRTDIPPTTLNPRTANSDRPRIRRVVDARSLAASRTGGKPANVLRGPKSRVSRQGPTAYDRKPRPPTKSAAPNSRKGGQTRAPKQSDVKENNETETADVNNVYMELAEKNQQTPARYNPRAPDLSSLKATWPSLPTNTTSYAAGVVEKLSFLSDRFPNGYVSAHELGKRLFTGQYVRFLDEEEKSRALAEAKKLSQYYADKVSQRKGDLVEPREVGFDSLNSTNQNTLLQTLVQGSYLAAENEKAGKPAVVGEIMRNLNNNGTYQTAGKSSQFIAKVESLLASSRPVKRA